MLKSNTPHLEPLVTRPESILGKSNTPQKNRPQPVKSKTSIFLGARIYREAEQVDFTRSLNDPSQGVFSEAFPLIYDELRRHAMSQMSRESRNHTLQPTELVHEAWLRVTDKGTKNNCWQNRAHFFGAAACAMRRILVESIRRKGALKRAGDQVRVDMEKVDPVAVEPGEKILLIDEALKELELTDPEKAKVVTLKFFGGHSNAEVAEIMGIGVRTAERHWAFAKVKLYEIIRSQA